MRYFLFFVSLSACGGDELAPVTFNDDVAPILEEHCVACHTEGGIAPVALTSYEATRRVAPLIASSTRARTMPPFIVDNSGSCNRFDDARWLSDHEIDTIARWVEQGAAEGEGTAVLVPGALPGLDEVSTTLDIGADYAPSTSADDDYRCFVVEPEFQGTRYLTAFEVHPGNARLVHHAIIFAPISADAGKQARALDGVEEGPGYTCFGTAGVLALPVMVWAPGTGATHYPEGTGIPLVGETPLVVQIHYNLLAGEAGESDRTTIDLQLADHVEDEASVEMLADFLMSLPPGRENAQTSHRGGFIGGSSQPATLWGAFPHMHKRGTALRVDVVDEQAPDVCLVDVPRWDFDWQTMAFYDTPIELASPDALRIRCTYDTRGETQNLTWGDGTDDEMCLNAFYVTR